MELNRPYLWSFGTLTIPHAIFEAMSHHWVWIEPSVCNAWLEKMQVLDKNARPYQDYVHALQWHGDDPRDTTEVARIVESLAQRRSPSACGVWTGSPLRKRRDFEVDHCIPYSRWFNNSLWNLMPATVRANQSKGDRLPSMQLLMESRERITTWWQEGFAHREDLTQRFIEEAEASLPGLSLRSGLLDVQEVFDAASWQVARIRRDQQIAQWNGLR